MRRFWTTWRGAVPGVRWPESRLLEIPNVYFPITFGRQSRSLLFLDRRALRDKQGAVQKFCDELNSRQIEVIRDNERLKHGQCIDTFMRDIGRSDHLCVFLSEGYLKSPNCMYELMIAWNRSKDNPDEFRDRVHPWIMPGVRIDRAEDRLKWATHWRDQRDSLQKTIDEHGNDGLASGELEALKRVKRFAEDTNEILLFFAKTLLPQSWGDFANWMMDMFDARPESLDNHSPEPSPPVKEPDDALPDLDAHYESLIEKLETAYDQSSFAQSVKPFVGCFSERAGTYHLGEKWRDPPIPLIALLDKVIEDLERPTWSGKRLQKKDAEKLLELIGYFAVLGLNRDWMEENLPRLHAAAVQCHDLERVAPRGGWDLRCNGLELLGPALAGSFARLEKIFETTAEDRAKLNPKKYKSVDEAEVQTTLMAEMVWYIEGWKGANPDKMGKTPSTRSDISTTRWLRSMTVSTRNP